EEEVVTQRRRDAGEQRRPQAVTDGDPDDSCQKYQVDVLDAEPWMDQLTNAKTGSDEQQCYPVRKRIERLRSFSRAHSLPWNGLRREFLAGDDIDADIAGAPYQVLHHRASPELKPPGTRRLPDDDLGHVIGVREAYHVVRNTASDAGNGERLASQRFCQTQRVGKPIALLVSQLQAPPRLDADGGPGRMQPV